MCTQQTTASDYLIPCPSVEYWYRGYKPQNSSPPYVLDVTDQDGRSISTYGPYVEMPTISLNGTRTGNKTEKFVGFIIYVYSEGTDEGSGFFVTPLPPGVSVEFCHFEPHDESRNPFRNAIFVRNSTQKEWDSFQIKWKSPMKNPSRKITISASVVKEYGVYWDGITLSLNYNGAAAIPVRVTSTLFVMYTVLHTLYMR